MYAEGTYAWIGETFSGSQALAQEAAADEVAAGVGDTLFLFLLRELNDDDCLDLEEASRRCEAAIADIQEVLDALGVQYATS